MKHRVAVVIITSFTLSPMTLCQANDVPNSNISTNNSAPTSNTGHIEYQSATATAQFDLDDIYHIPVATYQYLDAIFTAFYDKVTFNTSISDTTFKSTAHNELVSIPLIAENKQGIRLELFGNFSDPATQQLSNLSTDQALHTYYSNTAQLDFNDSAFSIGAGFSFKTSEQSKIKVIISNDKMPGYGSSNALLGFQTRF